MTTSHTVKVFLVEDEPPALRKLERMVAAEADLEVCGAASTCADAIAGISSSNPQLLILDIRLPDGTGFEVLQAIEALWGARDLQVIFLTAYDEYAVQAFDVAALDYLMKPVSQERFSAAIERVRERLAAPAHSPETALLKASETKYARRFLVERRKAAYFLPVDSIHHIAADRNYALVHCELGEFAMRTTMDALEKRLDPAEFARVSRSSIVRVAAIREVRLSEDHNYALVLHSGEEIECSKRYWTAALDRLL
jgi:two-component system, LytTR family, response regulator